MGTPMTPGPGGPAGFQTTRWSVVLSTGEGDDGTRQRSLEELCRAYWRPVYEFLRRRHGLSRHDSEDMTQAFFEYVIEQEVLPTADPERGRFRSYLKGVLRNFAWARERWEGRLKRAGDRRFVPLEPDLLPDDADSASPEHALDREWTRTVLDRAQAAVRERLQAEGRGHYWSVFASYAPETGADESSSYRRIAEAQGLTPKEVWRRLSRVREALRDEMRRIVLDTVADEAAADSEMETLLELAGRS